MAELHDAGRPEAQLYLADPGDGIGGAGAFFLLLDEPEVYGLPPDPVVTTRDLPRMWRHAALAAAGIAAAAVAVGVAGRAMKAGGGRRGGEKQMVPEADFSSYYGRPVLQGDGVGARHPQLTCSSAGWPGASSALAAAAQLSGHPELARAAKAGAAGAISLSMVALVHDLGRPARFINMLRVVKVTSPMSVGTWILSAYTPLRAGRRRLGRHGQAAAGRPGRHAAGRRARPRRRDVHIGAAVRHRGAGLARGSP